MIDTGRGREVRRNKRTSTSMLVTDWCPQSSAKQRQGRAGRVQPGICLKLYSSTTAERVMKVTNEPELRRVSIKRDKSFTDQTHRMLNAVVLLDVIIGSIGRSVHDNPWKWICNELL